MADIKFIDGLTVKQPHERAPDFVKATGSIKVESLKAFLASQSGEWVNFDVKVSKGGKWYCAVNEYVPKEKPQEYRAEGVSPSAGFSEPPPPEDFETLPF